MELFKYNTLVFISVYGWGGGGGGGGGERGGGQPTFANCRTCYFQYLGVEIASSA